ncbi:hypothetical protein EEW87_016235 [Janibacter melonis]|uniref:Uncharacterized protein n=1 Tax=Janibacter melonis TaxID=262209 RepID=A0A5P8FQY6_9MICO|nr:hypothetical protein [Janibacter melonis]MCB5991938.1 hypothetical protein [Janibacter melonis]QFQ31553.2 hypothetical protein EEW87_016235 [Janibacter melonis]
MSTIEIPMKPDADRTVRELLFELGQVEEAERTVQPRSTDPADHRRRATLRRRERQLVAELRRR